MSRYGRLAIAAALVAAAASNATELQLEPIDLPRIPATEPADALQTFRVKAGFHLELIAAEPLVADPIAISYDENGRAYVIEMRDYSERRPDRLGRVRLLEDTDDDGRFDKSTVFLDQLPWPTAVLCYDGGVFIGATPEIIYAKDTTGDGVADKVETIFTGFASDYAPFETNRLNVQAMLNSFHWGLDNRIHGVTSMTGGKVRSLKQPDAPVVELRGKDFSFDARTFDLRPESGGAQHGMSFDDRGRKFVCSNSSHIQQVIYEHRYTTRNPHVTLPPPLVDIPEDGPAAEVFRISPEEPWRVIRTRWRVAGLVGGPVEGGGRSSGYFTGATGATIYRGDAFPAGYKNDAFIADCGSNLVHRKKLIAPDDDVQLIARRPEDERGVEFIASTDNWFRPVQFANAPDGCLHILDMYREIIEHPWSLPPQIKKYLDLNSGNDRGRIYRIAPDGYKPRSLPKLGRATTAELVATLAHPNGWHRDTAARLLYQRQDKAAVPLLAEMLRNSKSPNGRLHALYALDEFGELTAAEIVRGLSDSDAAVRQHAVRLMEPLFAGKTLPDALWKAFAPLAVDSDPLVRQQWIFTSGAIRHPERIRALASAANLTSKSRWLRIAVIHAAGDEAAALFQELAGAANKSTGAHLVLVEAAEVIGARNKPDEIRLLVSNLTSLSDRDHATALVMASRFADGLRRAGSSVTRTAEAKQLEPLFAAARASATNAATPTVSGESPQVAAIRLLAHLPWRDGGPALRSVLEASQPVEAQREAITALSRYTDSATGEALIASAPRVTSALRGQIIDALLRRPERVRLLLEAMSDARLRRDELSSVQVNALRKHADTAIRAKTEEIFGPISTKTRQDAVKALLPALSLSGDAQRGKKIFTERCASCHRAAGEGFALGPDFTSVKSSGKETLLSNIIDPNREVQPKFVAYTIETKDGESLSGVITADVTSGVTLRAANGIETIVPRSNISRMHSQGQSLMPEALEDGLTPQDLADLLEFIVSAP